MASLTFGVLEIAYSDSQGPNPGNVTTTGDVATILENRYHVMQTFYDLKKGVIAQALADGMAVQIQNLLRGERASNPMFGAEQKIEHLFRSFLDANEMQKLAIALGQGPVSAAAMRGVNHRKKHPYTMKNKARPAFVDTGLYRSSFRATVKL